MLYCFNQERLRSLAMMEIETHPEHYAEWEISAYLDGFVSDYDFLFGIDY